MIGKDIVRHFCALSTAKSGNSPDEYEDAWAADPALGRFALADGATDSSYADYWAQLLVEDFVTPLAAEQDTWPIRLPPLQKRWSDVVDVKDLPWFAKNKAQKGAFATFLGFVLHQKDQMLHWNAVAVGDACLFLVREGSCQNTFPIQTSEEFSTSPYLIGSRLAQPESLTGKENRCKGKCYPGDCFWLMTDALAHWFLKAVEENNQPWEQLTPFLFDESANRDFPTWVDELRKSDGLRNDDVTLLGIAL